MKHLKKINEMIRDVEDWREQQYQDYQSSLSEEDEELTKCEICGDDYEEDDLDYYNIDGNDVLCCKSCREEEI